MDYLDFNAYSTTHHKECLQYGIDPLITSELLECYNNELDIDTVYQVASDLYCESFDTFEEALDYYIVNTTR